MECQLWAFVDVEPLLIPATINGAGRRRSVKPEHSDLSLYLTRKAAYEQRLADLRQQRRYSKARMEREREIRLELLAKIQDIKKRLHSNSP